jgi:hypothetical protein
MHFSEDDLKAALQRKDPGERFTQEVMARISQRQGLRQATASRRGWLREFWRYLRLRPALAGALAAVVIFGSLGLERYRRAEERRAGEAARQQALLALRITNAKLNHVLERVKAADE